MPGRGGGPAEERILLARQGWEGVSRFLHDLREGDLDLEKCERAIGGFAFADSQRDPFVEVLQRNMEAGDTPIVVQREKSGQLQIALPPPRRRPALRPTERPTAKPPEGPPPENPPEKKETDERSDG